MRDIGIVFWATCYVHEKYRFGLCFRVLRNQYVERGAYANVFKFNRENERFERGKLNFRCFHWFAAAMLESLRRAPTWRLHTKNYNFQWYLLPNNSSSEYRTSPKPWHVVYLLLLYDILISWLNLLNGKRFYFFTCVIIELTCVTWKPRIWRVCLCHLKIDWNKKARLGVSEKVPEIQRKIKIRRYG